MTRFHDPEPATPDLLIVGAGPTAISIGAAARRAGLSVLLVDSGPLCAGLLRFPRLMTYFSTRDLLEIADVPFSIPNAKPNREEAVVYYQGVARRYRLPLALYEDVDRVERRDDGFAVHTTYRGVARVRPARRVVLATGYFGQPKMLGVPGEELDWVRSYYDEPYPHYGRRVVLVGGGNTASEAALELWRNGVEVTVIHRRAELKKSVKYWLKPDLENRIAEGSIRARFETEVRAFVEDGTVRRLLLDGPEGATSLETDAVYVLIGYTPDADFERRCGIEIDDETLVPRFDPETCETNVPGLYVAGTIQAGRRTNRIFIENAREHGDRIVAHVMRASAGTVGQRTV
ncbi:MAG: YpdA family putative bacillithiol disulfide reductase [Acidobacteriota bacterium]